MRCETQEVLDGKEPAVSFGLGKTNSRVQKEGVDLRS